MKIITSREVVVAGKPVVIKGELDVCGDAENGMFYRTCRAEITESGANEKTSNEVES